MSLSWSGLGKASLELRQGVKVLFPGNLAFPPEETGGIGPKVAVCSVCNALEKPSVPLQHCLISFPLAVPLCELLTLPHGLLGILYKLPYFVISLLGVRQLV